MILHLSSLALSNFRNYESARLQIDAGPIVLYGANGSGKTSILEAISLLAPGKGLRRADIRELDNRNTGQPWVVSAQLHGRHGEVQIGTGRDPDPANSTDRRIVKIDGIFAKSHAELAEHTNILWLTPQMEQLFNEGISAGRKFLDKLAAGFDDSHAMHVNQYELAMRERNRLLYEQKDDDAWLSSLEHTMAEKASGIASGRLQACEHLNHTMAASTLSFPKAHIDVAGFVEAALKTGKSASLAEAEYAEILQKTRPQDALSGRTQHGPHRSELQVMHIKNAMPAGSCSTGEQKALLLSILLAQAHASFRWNGTVPILLLDEVVAHLDPIRRLELFEEICQIGAQTWMTGTDHVLFEKIAPKAQLFFVENGCIGKR